MSDGFLKQLFGLDGQVAVVIGGTGVLCGAMAQGLAQAGATVVVAGRDAEKGAARVGEIEALGGKAALRPGRRDAARVDRGPAPPRSLDDPGAG